MPRSPRRLLPHQSHPVDTLRDDANVHGGPTQLQIQYTAATASSAVTSKHLLSTVLWFAVLLYGLVPSRLDTSGQNDATYASLTEGRIAVTQGSSFLHANLDPDSVLTELISYPSSNFTAVRYPHPSLPWATVPECPQAAVLHPELALLLDLCPLLQAEPDTHADKFPGFAHLCDASRYALPCPMQAKHINSSSLARFTLACNKQQACRSWWLHHQSQMGVCGCAPLLMNLEYANQLAPRAEEKGLGSPALPSWTACTWLLIPLGLVASLVHILLLMQDIICGHLRDNSRSDALFYSNVHKCALVVAGFNCKPIKDLALWLYIYRGEGWGDGAVVMGVIAAVSNLPGSRWNVSFSYAAANYYIGLRYLLLIILGRDCERVASCLAITAAVLRFLHSVGLGHTLAKFGLIGRVRLQRLTEAAHLGCILKLCIELGADAPFVIAFIGSGVQYLRAADALGSLWQFVVRPAGWIPTAWHLLLATSRFLLFSLLKGYLRDAWRVQYLEFAAFAFFRNTEVRQRAQRGMISMETVRDQLAQHQRLKTGFFLEALVILMKHINNVHVNPSDETVKACHPPTSEQTLEQKEISDDCQRIRRYIVSDVLQPLMKELLYDTPLAIVTIMVSPLYKFWKIPGWRSKGVALLDIASTKCCCAYAWCNSWGQATFSWLGPICGVALVTSCNTAVHTYQFLQRRAMSAAGMFHLGGTTDTYTHRRWWCCTAWFWHWPKGIFSCNRQGITHTAPMHKGDQQPGTNAAPYTPSKIKLQPIRILRYLGSKDDKPATEAAHLAAAAKHVSAAEQGGKVQSDLVKAHRAEPATPSPHRAGGSGPAAEPDQAANSDLKLNKRERKEAKRAAKAAAAAMGEADTAPVLRVPTAREQDAAAVEAEPVKAVAPLPPAYHAPRLPTTLMFQDATAAEGCEGEDVHHKQGTAVTKANRAAKHTKVAVPFKVPDPQEPVGHTRAPKQPVGQHKHSLKLSAPHDPAAASQAAAAAPLADPIKHELPPKPRPHTAQKGASTRSATSSSAGSVQGKVVAATAVNDNRDTEDDADGMCIVCFAADRSAILAPCGHVAMCTTCTEGLLEWKKRDAVCPICRRKVESYVAKVYGA